MGDSLAKLVCLAAQLGIGQLAVGFFQVVDLLDEFLAFADVPLAAGFENLGKRLAERELALDISDAALDVLGSAGFDPVYGARPLKRAIQHMLENTLAERILAGEFVTGDTIRVDGKDGALLISKA